ncbi:MAG: GAF domain-containing protein [Bacillota bacterium]|nr:GAF domain-containing protein [Bacillota bacterium]MDW7682965.1 GAF domain-containing protein [Bacillota bacterium]
MDKSLVKLKNLKASVKPSLDACLRVLGAEAGFILMTEGTAVCLKPPFPENFFACEAAGPNIYGIFLVSIPLSNDVQGLLGFINKPGGFDAHDRRLTTVYAELITVKISSEYYIAERKQVEDELYKRLMFENLVSGISAKFMALSLDQTDAAIQDALGKIGEFVHVDRSYIFLFSKDYSRHTNTHEWCAEDIEPQSHHFIDTPVSILPWLMKQLMQLKTVHIPNVAELPVEAYRERDIFMQQQIRSLLVLPLLFSGRLIGFLGFDSVKEAKTWTQAHINVLNIVGEIFSNALMRREHERELAESNQRYQSLFSNNHAVMLLIDPQTGQIIDANPAACDYYGYSKQEMVSKRITEINELTTEEIFDEMDRAKRKDRNHFFFRHRLAGGGASRC